MNDLYPLPATRPTRIEVEQGDYEPLIYIRAFDGGDLIYRRLIYKTDEAKCRALLTGRLAGAGA